MHNFSSPSTATRVIKVVNDILGSDAEPQDNLRYDLGADSLDVIGIVLTLEEEFGVSLPDAECDECKTAQHLVDLVDRHLVKGQA